MAGVRFFAVIVVAILGYFAVQPVTFVVKTNIFIQRPPKDVYKALSDLRSTAMYRKFRCDFRVLLKDNKGVAQVYEATEFLPVFGSWEIPVTFNVTMEYTKPNRELHADFAMNVFALTGRDAWYLQPGKNEHGQGTYIKEEAHFTCPWILRYFTENGAIVGHERLLSNIKKGLEQRVASI